MSDKPRIFSGIQPSGNLTIGNYLGAITQWVQFQYDYECFYCVVDQHAITVPYDNNLLAEKTREVAAIYIAAGVDPEICTLFVQSHVPAHTELTWLLNCSTPIGWLQRMTQFKDKSSKQAAESVGTGLLDYPVLMASDILLYQTALVPVGEDQKQHIELTRDIAQRFNHLFDRDVFTIPEPQIPEVGARIMGLDDPLHKMSKSQDSQYHAVYILDPPKQIRKKIMRATTDSYRDIVFSDDPERAGINNLLTIYQLATGKEKDAIESEFAGKGYGDFKKAVAEAVVALLEPMQAKYNELMGEGGYLDEILAKGAARAAEVANATLSEVRDVMGFLPPYKG